MCKQSKDYRNLNCIYHSALLWPFHAFCWPVSLMSSEFSIFSFSFIEVGINLLLYLYCYFLKYLIFFPSNGLFLKPGDFTESEMWVWGAWSRRNKITLMADASMSCPGYEKLNKHFTVLAIIWTMGLYNGVLSLRPTWP